MSKPHIHWIGAGLASGPGLVSLATETNAVTVWDMSDERAKMLQAQMPSGRAFGFELLDLECASSVQHFKGQLNKGDVIVSMLPAMLHPRVGEIAIETGAHMVTSSYVESDMERLSPLAADKGVSLVNEVGLDPGIDHLFAHILVEAARRAGVLGRGHKIDFVSHCGGIPAAKTDFTYKFSWTPLGVLKALTSPAVCISSGHQQQTDKVWDAVSDITIGDETFEVYPNRNSLPYIEEYGLDGETNLNTFVRGTLRQNGWKKAWSDIFDQVENAKNGDLKALSEKLWAQHAYSDDEEDRTVLYVALTASDEKGEIWSASLSLDEVGSGWQTAMAKTVSLTVAEGAKAVMRGAFKPGAHAALTEPSEAKLWLRGLMHAGIGIEAKNVEI